MFNNNQNHKHNTFYDTKQSVGALGGFRASSSTKPWATNIWFLNNHHRFDISDQVHARSLKGNIMDLWKWQTTSHFMTFGKIEKVIKWFWPFYDFVLTLCSTQCDFCFFAMGCRVPRSRISIGRTPSSSSDKRAPRCRWASHLPPFANMRTAYIARAPLKNDRFVWGRNIEHTSTTACLHPATCRSFLAAINEECNELSSIPMPMQDRTENHTFIWVFICGCRLTITIAIWGRAPAEV